MNTSSNSSLDTSLIRDIYCGPEVLLETCVAVKFVDGWMEVLESKSEFHFWPGVGVQVF